MLFRFWRHVYCEVKKNSKDNNKGKFDSNLIQCRKTKLIFILKCYLLQEIILYNVLCETHLFWRHWVFTTLGHLSYQIKCFRYAK